jgi:hypothetical protein
MTLGFWTAIQNVNSSQYLLIIAPNVLPCWPHPAAVSCPLPLCRCYICTSCGRRILARAQTQDDREDRKVLMHLTQWLASAQTSRNCQSTRCAGRWTINKCLLPLVLVCFWRVFTPWSEFILDLGHHDANDSVRLLCNLCWSRFTFVFVVLQTGIFLCQ